jgi:hypothetical protein
MNIRRLLLPLVVAGLAALLWWRSAPGTKSLRYYNAEKYVAHADALIQTGYLRADCREDRPRIEVRIANAPAAESGWYEDSYLSADVRNFNNDPDSFGWTFLIDDDCRLKGVNPSVHRIELPFTKPLRWLGSLFYSGAGAQAMLRSANRTVTLRQPQTPVGAKEEAQTFVGGREDVDETGAVLFHFAGGPGQPAARVFPVGSEAVVNNRVRRGQPERTLLLGHILYPGRIARIDTGDWLHMEAESPRKSAETFVYLGGSTLAAASRMRLENDRYQRITEDPRLGLLPSPGENEGSPYLDLVAGGIEAALTSLPEPQARELARGFDVQLTLERAVQLRLSQAFHKVAQGIQNQHPDNPFAAGMTVLDGKTGDVLALATYPWEEDLADLSLEESERRRLLANQNLRLHPIGSAGKPFFYAAIAHAFPFLTGLVVDPHKENSAQRDILQCEIPQGYRVLEDVNTPVDFQTALQISSNRYTVELATLAMAASSIHATAAEPIPRDPDVSWPLPGKSSGIRIGGRPLTYAPDLGRFVIPDKQRPEDPESTAAVRCRSLDNFEEIPFRTTLERLTGAATYLGTDPQGLPPGTTVGTLERAYRTGRYDLSLFAPLLDHLFIKTTEEQRWKIRTAAQQMSPERVNLAFNQITRMREDFVNLLLGGGTSIWTNVQLTEALSRLVTGRAVESRIVRRLLPRQDGKTVLPGAEAPRPLAPELDLLPTARQAVLEGIARTWISPGTAAAMAPAIRKLQADFPNDRIDLFSKTGSPILEHAVPRRVAQALEGLVGKTRLVVEGKILHVRTRVGEVAYAEPEQPGRQAFRDALERALRELGLGRPSRRFVSYLADLLDDLNEDLKTGKDTDPDAPIVAQNGILRLNRNHRLFRQNLIPGNGAVYVFSLVRRPKGMAEIPSPADFANPDSRIITVALFFTVGPSSKLAVVAARDLIPTVAPLLR